MSSNSNNKLLSFNNPQYRIQWSPGVSLPIQTNTQWQNVMNSAERQNNADDFSRALFPFNYDCPPRDVRLKELITFSRMIEDDAYQAANSHAEYRYLLEKKMQKFKDELLDKRRMRNISKSNGNSDELAVVGDFISQMKDLTLKEKDSPQNQEDEPMENLSNWYYQHC